MRLDELRKRIEEMDNLWLEKIRECQEQDTKLRDTLDELKQSRKIRDADFKDWKGDWR